MDTETLDLIRNLNVKAALARQLDGSYMDKGISEKAIAAFDLEKSVHREIIDAVQANLRLFRDVSRDFYSVNAVDATKGRKFLFYVYDKDNNAILSLFGVFAKESLSHIHWEWNNRLVGVRDEDVNVVDVAPVKERWRWLTMADCKLDVCVPHSANEWKEISDMADSSVEYAKYLNAAFKKAVISRTEIYEAQCRKTMDAIVDNTIG